MKQIKLLIIILSIFIVGLIVAMFVITVMQDNTNTNNIVNTKAIGNVSNTISNVNTTYGDAPPLTFNPSLQEVQEESLLYYISNAINKYFNYIKDGNTQAVNELGGNNLYNIQNNVKYVVKQAYGTRNEHMAKYYTYGILTVANGDFTAKQEDVYMIIYLTTGNKGYVLETISKSEYQSRQELRANETIQITQGTYNICDYEYVNNVKQMEIYLDDFVFRVLNNTEESYNLLNKEYRDKRFGNINEYVKYLNEKIEQLQSITLIQYNVTEEDEYKIYSATDENGNYYQIKEKAYMEYELILDNYTLDDYSGEKKDAKINKSVKKFISMINSADYTNAYQVLKEDFKQSNFPTEQDFINYVKDNWYVRNVIASQELMEDGICIVEMKDGISTTSNSMEKQFKVLLGEGMDFAIEFNI